MSGGEPATTNNRMELMAVIEALKRAEKGHRTVTSTPTPDMSWTAPAKWMNGWKNQRLENRRQEARQE